MRGCCDPTGYGKVFDERRARKTLAGFRRNGLDSTAGPMVGALALEGIEGATVVEVGAGIGSATVALLNSGAATALAFEMSAGYQSVSAELLAEYGHTERVTWRTVDFVPHATGLEAADVVFLNRVVCCYPNMPEMVDAAAGTTGRHLAMSYPRRRWWVRLPLAMVNGFLWLRRTSFRIFVHDPKEIARRTAAAGLTEVASGHNLVWEWRVWERVASSE